MTRTSDRDTSGDVRAFDRSDDGVPARITRLGRALANPDRQSMLWWLLHFAEGAKASAHYPASLALTTHDLAQAAYISDRSAQAHVRFLEVRAGMIERLPEAPDAGVSSSKRAAPKYVLAPGAAEVLRAVTLFAARPVAPPTDRRPRPVNDDVA